MDEAAGVAGRAASEREEEENLETIFKEERSGAVSKRTSKHVGSSSAAIQRVQQRSEETSERRTAEKEKEKGNTSRWNDSERIRLFIKKFLRKQGSISSPDHVRDTLDQASAVSVGSNGNSVVSGVKVMSYFTLHIKPAFSTHLRELRELHHLAACIDTIRIGRIATAGDAMAARFVAIHQSLLDSNWHTARHMEIYPMEDSTAASTAVVLATRRHSRQVAKALGYGASTGWPRGRGKGGRGEWTYPGDSGAGKGDKGKGKKGRGKGGKGRDKGGDWSNQVSEWKNQKEKPEDKTG